MELPESLKEDIRALHILSNPLNAKILIALLASEVIKVKECEQ